MQKVFDIKQIDVSINTLNEIGFDKSYTHKGIKKHIFKSIKICGLTCAQANILKQTALSTGTDCAVHREVITGKIEKSDCILSGTIDELLKIAQKIQFQPFKLKQLAEEITDLLENKLSPLKIKKSNFDWSRPYIMGILNITPDSFSDGGLYFSQENAVNQFKKLVKEGADIIDIGGESTRPLSTPVNPDVESSRIIPVIKEIRTFDKDTILSVDTRNAKTAEQALNAGADIINDISALSWDSGMVDVIKKHDCPIVLTYSKENLTTQDILSDIYEYFKNRIKYLTDSDIKQENIIIDAGIGIGFGKTNGQSYEIIKGLKQLKSLNCPILLGHSRKSFIKNILNTLDNNELDCMTLAISQSAINDVNIFRVHNIKLHKNLLTINKQFSKS